MDTLKLRQLYGRLKGIQAVTGSEQYVSLSLGQDYNSIMAALESELGENLSHFKTTLVRNHDASDNTPMCRVGLIKEKLAQVISYLEYGFHLAEEIVEIGSIYNSIQDEELKSRCADLLSAPGNFDRVINQATQVLEDRIRRKSKYKDQQTGVQLANTVLQTDLSKTVLILSQDKDEHEGYCHTVRGIMFAYRNPTHHQISNKYSREQALIVCSFIDLLLQVIDQSTVRT
jgi:hypothetical protein